MKPNFLFFLAIIFTLLFSPVFANAESLTPFVMPSARAAGFGGIHAAQGDDISAIFSNPASFVRMKKQFSAAELSVSVYGPVFQFFDKALNASGDVSDLIKSDDFVAGFDIGGPIALGMVDNGFGLGFFNRTASDVTVISTPSERLLTPAVWEDFLLVAGYSFRVLETDAHVLDLGFLGKGFYRMKLGLSAPTNDVYQLISKMWPSPLQTQLGIGIDLGIKYTFAENLALALVWHDAFSPALVTNYNKLSNFGDGGTPGYGYVQSRLALGILYHIKNDFLDKYYAEITLMADYRDFINLFEKNRRNPFLNVSLGAEISMLKIMKLRMGMADALPCGGVGVDLTFMKLDVAVRGKEIGNNPGDMRVFAFDIGLLFRY